MASPIDLEDSLMQMITHSGMAKKLAYDGFHCIVIGKIEDGLKLYKESDEELVQSHRIQARLLSAEYDIKNNMELVLLIHAMDMIMTTMSEVNLLKEFSNILKMKGDKNGQKS